MKVLITTSLLPERLHLFKKSLPTWWGADVAVFSEGFESPPGLPSTVRFHTSTPTRSGSPIQARNWGAKVGHEQGYDYIIFTHAEILFSQELLSEVLAFQAPLHWSLHFRAYWLPPSVTTQIPEDTTDFDPATLKLIPGFYNRAGDPNGPKTWNVKKPISMQSTTTFVMPVETLSLIYPQPQFDCWGAEDCWSAQARKKAKIETYTGAAFVYHQAHKRLKMSWDLIKDRLSRPEDFIND